MSAELRDLYAAHIAHLDRGTKRALNQLGYEGVVIHSGSPSKRSSFDDQYWPLSPVPTFAHWAHAPLPDMTVCVSREGAPRMVALIESSFWEAPLQPDWELLRSAMEVDRVSTPDRLSGKLPSGPKVAFIGEDSDRAVEWGFVAESINPPPLIEALEALRVHKTEYELSSLRRANELAAAGHRAAKEAFEANERSELALHLAYLGGSGQDSFDTPYQNIVALGDAAAVLHYVTYRREPKPEAGSMLIDAGATCRGYASDITRTYAANDESSRDFAALVAAMDELQHQVCREIQVGQPYEALHDRSHELLAPVLRNAGLVRDMSDEAMVQQGVTRKFFPHGLGHSLGLQTHDVGCRKTPPAKRNPYLRNTSIISAGQVFTIEPGLYFIPSLMDSLKQGAEKAHIDWSTVSALARFGGIRIEDNIAVHEDSIENLTRPHV